MTRVAGQIAVSWDEYRQAIIDAPVPDGTFLVKNSVGELTLVNSAGDYLGYIDALLPGVEVFTPPAPGPP